MDVDEDNRSIGLTLNETADYDSYHNTLNLIVDNRKDNIGFSYLRY